MEAWRTKLYFLGFAASLAFSLRFLIQWLASEKKKTSHTPPLFWKLSLLGNFLMALHSFIQVQIHISLVQACNGVFSWRNLNLIKSPQRQASFYSTLLVLVSVCLFVFLGFSLQAQYLYGHFDWVRTPTTPWSTAPGEKLSIFWHTMGTIGILLFASRFWVQWWQAEKKKESQLNHTFWWLSITGSLISLIYFIRMDDLVNILGQSFSILPAIRNLQLLRKAKKRSILGHIAD